MMPNWKEEIKLPVGKTCSDCIWLEGCEELYHVDGTEVACHFMPSKFIERTEPNETPKEEE